MALFTEAYIDGLVQERRNSISNALEPGLLRNFHVNTHVS